MDLAIMVRNRDFIAFNAINLAAGMCRSVMTEDMDSKQGSTHTANV
jgi:hypothetical protein